MNEQNILSKIILAVFIISCPFFTILFTDNFTEIYRILSFFLSFIVSMIIGFKYINKIEYNKKILIISGLISLYVGSIISHTHEISISSILSLPAITIFVYLIITKLIPIIKKEYMELTELEKKYIIITGISAIVITLILESCTTIFYNAFYRNRQALFDVIYTTDTGDLVTRDAFTNISNPHNDIRQPLFAVFSLPFGIIAHILSDMLFFIPSNISYGMMLSFIQIILMAIIVIMITKMLKVDEKSKILFYLMFIISAPYIVYTLCVEQYIIALFYLILTIYVFTCKKVEVNYTYIGAVGTLMTSGVIFPMITNAKGFKNYVINTFKCFLGFLTVLIISGQLPQFIVGAKVGDLVEMWTGGATFYDKLYQFFNFVSSTIFYPESTELVGKYYYMYQLAEVNSINIIGIVILAIVTLGFILNYKEKFAQICFSWVMFSVVILLVIGWGVLENGMFLYSSYFFWAYLCLIYMLVRKICKNIKYTNIAMSSLIIIMAIYNIPQLLKFMEFAINYY